MGNIEMCIYILHSIKTLLHPYYQSVLDRPRNPNQSHLFIVQKTIQTYNEREWLHCHSQQRNDIKRAAKLVSNPNLSRLSLLIVTGAGMCCNSNLPDYGSNGGFWNDYMSKSDWFNSDPTSAWGFYTHIWAFRDCFYMVVKAGFEKRKLIQTHGSLYHLQCLDYCGQCGIVRFVMAVRHWKSMIG